MKPHLRNGTGFAGKTIGLLGGSFNPAHDGHLAMSLYALKQLGLDQIWWMVSPQNPLKSAKDMASLDKRMARATRVATHPKLCVTAIESELGTHYTADTLRVLRRRFPRTRFVWLMGADNLRQIPAWKEWQDIFRTVPVAVFRRPGYPAGRNMGKAAICFDKAWQKTWKKGTNAQTTNIGPAWIMLDNKLNYLSATQIRKDSPTWQV